MRKKLYYMLFLSFLMLFIGCIATYDPKKVNISKNDIVIGWKKSQELGLGYYVLVEELGDGKWIIKKISEKPIRGRENERQEVLFVSKSLNYVQPFFEEAVFYPKLKNFKCVPSHKESEKKVYTPCNSRLTKINVLTTVLSKPNNFNEVTYGIDTEKISQIIEQTNLLEKVRLYNSLIEEFFLEKKKYHNFVSNISVKVDKIEDKTGLFLVKPDDVNLNKRMVKREIVNLPEDFNENFDKYDQEDIKNLFVNKKIELQYYVTNPILSTYRYYALNCFGIISQNFTKIRILYNTQNNTSSQVKIPVIIDSCNLINPYPSNFLVKDKNLLVKVMSLDKLRMKLLIENKTTSYVKISSVTLYYNDKILNVNNLNIELPPKALKEDVYIPAIGFNFLPLQVREFKKVTRNNLNSHLFNFGLAIKYSIVATNIEKTLYKVNRYNLATILFQN